VKPYSGNNNGIDSQHGGDLLVACEKGAFGDEESLMRGKRIVNPVTRAFMRMRKA